MHKYETLDFHTAKKVVVMTLPDDITYATPSISWLQASAEMKRLMHV